MKKTAFFLMIALFLFEFCNQKEEEKQIASKKLDKPIESIKPIESQGLSLLEKPLLPPKPSQKQIYQYNKAKSEYEKNINDPETLIWYGRRSAYMGNYLQAIQLYSQGIKQFPQDTRFWRHRGHRYITLRKFDQAIADFLQAVKMIEGKKDEVEPDGIPNARNIPVSTLHHNIWYHLGLAYYLKNDMENALKAYSQCLQVSTNDDGRVASSHWLYMILRRMGRHDDAQKVLLPIHQKMDVIENMAYHQLCLFYKGQITMDQLKGSQFDKIMNDAVLYGLANWYLYNGQEIEGLKIIEELLQRSSWASFGYIAAESDYVRLRGKSVKFKE